MMMLIVTLTLENSRRDRLYGKSGIDLNNEISLDAIENEITDGQNCHFRYML